MRLSCVSVGIGRQLKQYVSKLNNVEEVKTANIPCLNSSGFSCTIQCPQSMLTVSERGKTVDIRENAVSGI